MLIANVQSYVKGCHICLASKSIKHKLYSDLHSFPISTHWWKDLSIDFITILFVSTKWKSKTYDLILVIIDQLKKMIYYKPVKVIINAPALVEVIIKMIIQYHGLPNSIVSDCGLVFISKFWLLLLYFLKIKQKLFIAFYPKIEGRIKRQNSTMEAYLWAFVHFEQNNWTRLLPIAEIAYNNTKNVSTGHKVFELNCGFHSQTSYQENIDPYSQLKWADKLANKHREMITIYTKNF